MSLLGFHLAGAFTDNCGLSNVAREVAISLYKLGVPVKITPILGPHIMPWNPDAFDQRTSIALKEMQRNPLADKFVNILMRQPHYLRATGEEAVANIIYTTFETDRIPYVWKEIVEQGNIDEVWVPSKFNMETFEFGGIRADKLRHVQQGFNPRLFTPSGAMSYIRNRPSFLFYSMMDWTERKGFDILLNAYLQEFSNKDNVGLMLKVFAPLGREAVRDEHIKNIENTITEFKTKNKSNARVFLNTDPMTDIEIAQLHRAASCYIITSRGEGWNLPALQSMACGVPVIVPNATGHLDFCNKDNSLLIKTDKKIISDINWLLKEKDHNGHYWYEPQLEHTKYLMRQAYTNPGAMKKLGKKAAEDVKHLTWESTAKHFIDNLLRLKDERGL